MEEYIILCWSPMPYSV